MKFFILLLLIIIIIGVIYLNKKTYEICLDDDYFYIYIKNVFNDKEYDYIKRNINNDNLKKNPSNADNYGKYIYNTNINTMLYKKTSEILKNIDKIKRSNVLSEYRIYGSNSSGMDWHKDTLISNIPQYEVVYVIHNTSDSKTQLELKNKIKNIYTQGNDILIVKANGIKHKVTPIKNNGYRSIIKTLFIPKNGIENDEKVYNANNKY